MQFAQTFSRGQLQAMSELDKQHHIKHMIDNQIADHVLVAAREGRSSYFHIVEGRIQGSLPTPPFIKPEELVLGLKYKFPECKVTFEDTWMNVDKFNKQLRRGVLIDWSNIA